MPPWRTTLEIRAASMPDSRATMVSASSDEARCCTSKSAGTYSASITGVIGSTLSSPTEPLQVCDSVAAVAIAGFARSVSARSIGTRMDLNIARLRLRNHCSIFSCPGRDAALLQRCIAEPGPYQAPAFVTAPALQRTASQVLRAALRPGNETRDSVGTFTELFQRLQRVVLRLAPAGAGRGVVMQRDRRFPESFPVDRDHGLAE